MQSAAAPRRFVTEDELIHAICTQPEFQPFREIVNISYHLVCQRKLAKKYLNEGNAEKAEYHQKQAEYIKKYYWPKKR